MPAKHFCLHELAELNKKSLSYASDSANKDRFSEEEEEEEEDCEAKNFLLMNLNKTVKKRKPKRKGKKIIDTKVDLVCICIFLRCFPLII